MDKKGLDVDLLAVLCLFFVSIFNIQWRITYLLIAKQISTGLFSLPDVKRLANTNEKKVGEGEEGTNK